MDTRAAISINPATGEKIGEYARISTAEAKQKVRSAHEAFLSWRETDFSRRAAPVHRLAQLLPQNKEKYARLATLEIGLGKMTPDNDASGSCPGNFLF